MNQELFKNLPSEVVIDILSRLPLRTIVSCKCVQKSWYHLVETQEFVKYHLFKSTPGLVIRSPYKLLKFFELEDGIDVEHHDLHYKLATEFSLNSAGMRIMGSANGLLFLCELSSSNTKPDTLCICNPVTRDYINLPFPLMFLDSYEHSVTYGFGMSKMTSKYKVVRIFHYFFEAKCEVYTLGTGSWRRHASSCTLLEYKDLSNGVFVNGNLHWVVRDLGTDGFFLRISCFDLEMEHFSTLSAPSFPWIGERRDFNALDLFAWGDCLDLCDNTSRDEIVLWLMQEYDGVEKLWTQEFAISNRFELLVHNRFSRIANPIKIFKDGDILIMWGHLYICYSTKTNTVHKVDVLNPPILWPINAILHTPCVISLQIFGLDIQRRNSKKMSFLEANK